MSAAQRSSVPSNGLKAAGGDELHLDLFRTMTLIRHFEEAVQRLFLRGEVFGSTHLCIGQEAVSAGVCSVVDGPDRVTATYRGHGHALALGVDPRRLMAEMLGKETGICAGRAGSMNVVDLEHRLIGCFGIVGGSMAAAVGAALSLRRTGGVALAFFGDGTANQAYFHECLNFAQVFSLPVVFVCENNQYGEFTPVGAVTAGGILSRPMAMGIHSERIDGNDVWAVRTAAREAFELARAGKGPVFLEAETYRFSDHGRGDPIDYRPPGEMDEWRHRDPIDFAERRLVDEHGVEPDRIADEIQDIQSELGEMVEAARKDAFPAAAETEATEFKQ